MERWFSTGKRRSPVTNEALTNRSTQLTPNKVLKTMIQNYRRDIGKKLILACSSTAATSGSGGGAAAEPDAEAGAFAAGAHPLTSLSLAAFVEAGADLNIRDGDGNTPLMLLVAAGKLGLASELLDCGARASARNDLGTAALDLCAKLRADPLGPAVERPGGGGGGGGLLPAGSKARTAAIDALVRELEAAGASEALADEEDEKRRAAATAASRQAARDEDAREAAAGAAGGLSPAQVAEALSSAHVGPGTGFFPSLFALQFTGALRPPLERRDVDQVRGIGAQGAQGGKGGGL